MKTTEFNRIAEEQKKADIEKTCKWLIANARNLDYVNMEGDLYDMQFVEDFKKIYGARTMKTIDEMIAVMTAFRDGKKIEQKDWEDDNWVDCERPIWDWSVFEFRIKPEEPKPTYRPYQSAEEILEDMRLHGPMVEDPTCDGYSYVSIDEIPTKIDMINLGNGMITTPSIMIEKGMTWQDGTPFGRREEE